MLGVNMQTESSVKFFSAGQALHYYNENKPGRLRSIDLFGSSKSTVMPDLSGYSPTDIWVRVFGCLIRSLKYHSKEAQLCFAMRNIGARDQYTKRKIVDKYRGQRRLQLASREIAKILGISKSSVNRKIEAIMADFEDELRRQKLLDSERKYYGEIAENRATVEVLKKVR